jgi:hypothetical protein
VSPADASDGTALFGGPLSPSAGSRSILTDNVRRSLPRRISICAAFPIGDAAILLRSYPVVWTD